MERSPMDGEKASPSLSAVTISLQLSLVYIIQPKMHVANKGYHVLIISTIMYRLARKLEGNIDNYTGHGLSILQNPFALYRLGF
jgi:hypothetical protein